MHADIIILAAIAAFVILRLRSVLGQKIGQDQPPKPKVKDVTPDQGRIIQLPALEESQREPEIEVIVPEEDTSQWPENVREGVTDIRKTDRQFTLHEFLEGAKTAFEMVLTAFNKDDRDTLKALLSKELFANFKNELETRKKADESVETTLVAILSASPTEIQADKSRAKITLRIESEQMQVKRGKEGKIVEGSASNIHTVEDIWTFERDLRSLNPNWTIMAT